MKKIVLLLSIVFINQIPLKSQNPLDEFVDSMLNKTHHLSDSIRTATLIGQGVSTRYNPKIKPVIDEGVRLAYNRKVDYEIAFGLYTLGNFFLYNGDIDSAHFYLDKALEYGELQTDPVLYPSILYSKGGIYTQVGNTPKAIEYMLQAKKIIESIDTSNATDALKRRVIGQFGIIGNSLASAYKNIEEYDKAIQLLDETYNKFVSIGSDRYAGIVLSNKADYLIKMEQYKEAIKVLNEAYKIKLISGVGSTSIAYTDLNMGIAYAGDEQFDTALNKLNKALEIFESAKMETGIMYALIERGLVNVQLEKWNESITDCKKGKALSIANRDSEYQIKACACLHKGYSEINEYKLAYENHIMASILKDSVFNENSIKKTTQMEMQYEFDKEKEIKELEIRANKRQNNVIKASLLGLLLLISFIGILVYKNFRASKKSANILSEKNKIISNALEEKETLLKEIHHRVKNNLQVISSLLSLQSKNIDDNLALEAIEQGRNRVQSMALIHQNLYQDEDLVGVDPKAYIDKLTESLFDSYKIDHEKVHLKTNVNVSKLDVDLIIPIGLVLNELISNSLKYAFNKNESGEISIGIHANGDSLHIEFEDNGIGLPNDFKLENATSLGFRLISLFAKKLKANLHIDGKNGTNVQLIIPDYLNK